MLLKNYIWAIISDKDQGDLQGSRHKDKKRGNLGSKEDEVFSFFFLIRY